MTAQQTYTDVDSVDRLLTHIAWYAPDKPCSQNSIASFSQRAAKLLAERQAARSADGDSTSVDSIRALLVKVLMRYRCNRTVDEEGEPLQLVDVLSPGEGGTIQLGIEEIEYLAEYLADELAPQKTQAARSVVVSDEDVEAPEIFAGTKDALSNLTVRKNKQEKTS